MHVRRIFILLLSAFSVRTQAADLDCLRVGTEAHRDAFNPNEASAAARKLSPPPQLSPPLLLAYAYAFSKSIYAAPDLEQTDDPTTFTKAFDSFLASIPSQHRLYHLASNPANGLKYAIYAPKNDGPGQPWILSIAGTETVRDWTNDLIKGFNQLSSLTNLFSKCLFQNDKGVPSLDRPLIIIGHSLGGGLAQALYYLLQERLQSVLKTGFSSPLHLVTLNSLGGFGVLQEFYDTARDFHPEYIENDKVRNFYMSNDQVARLSKHLGPTYELIPYGRDGKKKDIGIVTSHSLETILETIRLNGELKIPFPTTPSNLKPPTVVAGLDWFFRNMGGLDGVGFVGTRIRYALISGTNQTTNTLLSFFSGVLSQPLDRPGRSELLNYLDLLAKDEEARLRARLQFLSANAFRKKLNSLGRP